MRTTTLGKLLAWQLPTFALSLVLAETFYKFGSFSLEAVAFLATWYALDYGVQYVRASASRLRRTSRTTDN